MIKNLITIILTIFAASLGGAKAYIDHRLGVELNTVIKSIADKVTIKYESVSTSLLGSVVIDNLRLTTPDYPPVQINTAILYKAYQFYDPNQLPQQMSINIQGVQFSISNTAQPIPVLIEALGYAPYYISSKELRGLGYARVNADIDIFAKSNGDNMSLSGTVNAHAWGELRLSAEVPAPKKWAAPQIQSLTLSYINNGLINRVFTRLAQRNTMTIDHFKQMLITKFKNDIRQARITLDTSSLQQFIQNPYILTIHLQPTSPIRIGALFSTTPKRLGLKITSSIE